MTASNPIHEDVGVQANMVFIEILPIRGNISSDQIGWLPVTSSDSDAIISEPLTSRAETELVRAVKKLYERLK